MSRIPQTAPIRQVLYKQQRLALLARESPSFRSQLQSDKRQQFHQFQQQQKSLTPPRHLLPPFPSTRTNSCTRFSIIPPLGNKGGDDITPEEKHELEQKMNLSNLIDKLKTQIPNILEHNLSKDLISNNIYLRICPSQFDENYLPKLHGTITYNSACKAITLFITSIILSPQVKLHISSIKTSKKPDPQCMFDTTTKVYVRWSTCMPNCEHLGVQSTSNAHFGSHKWSHEDTKKLMGTNVSLSGLIGKLTGAVMGVSKEKQKDLERVICGVFIFELNEDCNQIVVHTIENMNIIERFEEEPANALRVC
ncbi:unnamed protein product [Candida parapsilosis]|uniref:Uncharacterized protein n=1 Tax=Candida parapsilosis (strain CDC 317 / ATCC MYA-4646) TaxID=578454 RepID=G8B5K1_CANPC|nr:uncharacterized protein CPAR2_603120 [Candida parapsilosis]KAI5901529.1 hypothetical protein K4G60_g666 [Candida parapsilosis]KAI5906373.1 hypothetical protein K4G61_g30 [Candida parapsilosis]CAD1813680.1 unnamed protein product [Candida parapsilosis]CCE39893.1 hypothetical protein CPAR2_603120 [Candida parapsilosis]